MGQGKDKRPVAALTVTLPRRLAAQLLAHCLDTGEEPADVAADAVALHLDALGRQWDEGAQAWWVPAPIDLKHLASAAISDGATAIPTLPLGAARSDAADVPRRPAPRYLSAGAGCYPASAASSSATRDATAKDRLRAAAKAGAPLGPAPARGASPPPSDPPDIPAFLRRER